MRLSGSPNVWAVGDCAHIMNAFDAQVAPTTGQFAERQGRQVAENIVRVLRGQPIRPFAYKPLGQLCAIGERKAVAEILGLRLSGFPAWWLWRTVYLLKSPSWSRRVKVAFDWTWELLFPRDLAYPRVDKTERVSRAHYRPGDHIFVEGEPAMNFYVVEQGEVEALRRDSTGQPQLLTVFGPGEFFGEISLLDGSLRLASVRARTAVELLVMGKEVFSQVSGAIRPFRNLLTQALRWRRPRLNPRLTHAWAGLERQPLSTFMEGVPEHRLSPDDTFEDAVRLFDHHGVEFLCVLDGERRLQGVITRNELFEAFAQEKTGAAKVRDFMRADPVVITPADTSLMGGDLMNKHDLDWLPVVEGTDSRRLIGIIRSERMLRHLVSHLSAGRSEEPASA